MKNLLILALLLSPLSITGTGCAHDDMDDHDGVTRTEKKTTVKHDRNDDDAHKVTTEKKTTVYDRD